jgi:hypothetical protein
MTKKSLVVVVAMLLVGCLAAYRYGISVAQQGAGGAVTDVQLMLAFNHMQRYQEIHTCLERGRTSEAQEKLAHSALTQRELVAQLLASTDSPSALAYIEKRAREPLDALRAFKSPRGASWSEPACQ